MAMAFAIQVANSLAANWKAFGCLVNLIVDYWLVLATT